MESCGVAGAGYATALTLTNLPWRPRSRNSTTPVTLAKSVSSLPQPTLSPGFRRVPRWRTMIEPPGTSCPPNTLTPSRCALESRPFLELPNPFLCAILHLNQNVAHLHFREVLAMPYRALILLLALELEDQHFLSPAVADDGAFHGSLAQIRAGEQTFFLEYGPQRQIDFGADLAFQLLHADYVARGNPVLFSAGLNDCMHG